MPYGLALALVSELILKVVVIDVLQGIFGLKAWLSWLVHVFRMIFQGVQSSFGWGPWLDSLGSPNPMKNIMFFKVFANAGFCDFEALNGPLRAHLGPS